MADIALIIGSRSTVRVAEVVAAAYVAVASCDAVTTVVPPATMVTSPVVALTVATAVLELVYVMAPLLLVLGAVNVKAAESYVFVIADIAPSCGLPSTVRVVEVLPAAYVEVATCDAVMVVVPAPAIVMSPVAASTVAIDVLELV